MIDITQINPFGLPSVPIEDLGNLPAYSGIYFVITGDAILYVGKSMCIFQRWQSHHKLSCFEAYEQVRVAWLAYASQEEELREVEKAFIDCLRPPLNQVSVPRENIVSLRKQTIVISQDLARRLKVYAANHGETIASIATRAFENLLAEEED